MYVWLSGVTMCRRASLHVLWWQSHLSSDFVCSSWPFALEAIVQPVSWCNHFSVACVCVCMCACDHVSHFLLKVVLSSWRPFDVRLVSDLFNVYIIATVIYDMLSLEILWYTLQCTKINTQKICDEFVRNFLTQKFYCRKFFDAKYSQSTVVLSSCVLMW